MQTVRSSRRSQPNRRAMHFLVPGVQASLYHLEYLPGNTHLAEIVREFVMNTCRVDTKI